MLVRKIITLQKTKKQQQKQKEPKRQNTVKKEWWYKIPEKGDSNLDQGNKQCE